MSERALTWRQRVIKRTTDLVVALTALMLTGWLLVVAWGVAALETRANGFFTQERVGLDGKRFRLIKIRTMHPGSHGTTVTTATDPRITRSGSLFRRLKIDELPQFLNVVVGHMSVVGPRPDVPGFADRLEGPDRIILGVRPGITGPATLAYRDEDKLLASVEDPERYNREVIFPAKVKLNREYVERYSLAKDLLYLLQTVLPGANPRGVKGRRHEE